MVVALPFIAVAASLAGTALAVDSSNKQAKFQSSVAQMNADIDAQNAARSISDAQIAAQEQDRVNAGVLGQQINAQGGSGLSATSGSFALGRRSAKELARLDSLNVAQRGYLDAFNFRVGEANSLAQASAAKSAGKNAVIGGIISGVGTAASGISGISGSLVGSSTSKPRAGQPGRPI